MAKDWKGVVSQHEMQALLSEVFINRVQEEFRLNSKMAQYGELTEEQMYNAVKRHEVYLGRTKCLGGGGSTTSTSTQKSTLQRTSTNMYKSCFQKTTAFVAAPMEESESTPTDSGLDTSEESSSNPNDPASEDLSGLYIPDFLGEANNGEWGLTIRMAKAIQADEWQQQHCFICQSPNHFVRNCPQAKNV